MEFSKKLVRAEVLLIPLFMGYFYYDITVLAIHYQMVGC
jgi:hypothetical protein